MNVIEFKSRGHPIAFCFIDNTYQYDSAWTKELIKNLSDYVISNLFNKGFDVFQSQDEDSALREAAVQGYKHAVVFYTGTEFINGRSFFDSIERLVEKDYAIYGHILDRKNAYYELHHQCYLINLDVYRKFEFPSIGKTKLNSKHRQIAPTRSVENIHDDYTPIWVTRGEHEQVYDHKMHGWNIISLLLKNNYKIYAFDDSVRTNKKHYYPEHQREFLKHVSWAYMRSNYCVTDYVHFKNTEIINLDKKYKQIITPASGDWFLNYIDTTDSSMVVLYDYNQKSLDYWKNTLPKINKLEYKFIKIDLLGKFNVEELLENKEPNTLFNLSNIFCYEGTVMFSSLEYRLCKEKEILNCLPQEWSVIFSSRAASGFTDKLKDVKINDLQKPTWHFGSDWNE